MKNKISIFEIFNYSVDYELDNHLRKYVYHTEIYNIDYGRFNSYITLKDENNSLIKIEYWDENKYYAWFSNGKISVNGVPIYSWKNKRPKRKTMNALLKKIEYFEEENEK